MTATALIIGGAGFIGCNLAAHLARHGHRVRIYDDLSRGGAEHNLSWLQRAFAASISSHIADVRDRESLRRAIADVDVVFHLAAQVAVTTSLDDPWQDFDVNARGTVEVLEAVRARDARPAVVFTSTNKVYGCLPDLALHSDGGAWHPDDRALAEHGIDEQRPLEFRTPYGCSKGAADQYVLDYAHSFGVPATVFRMSCIYGPHQRGTEDQGWVAHFLIRALAGEPITIYGDGKQVRDVLFVDDLADAFTRAWADIDRLKGRAFNIGGGPANTISLHALLAMIERLHGSRPEVSYRSWRTGDQRYYVSNTSAFRAATGWRPRISASAGVEALYRWLSDQRLSAAGGSAHG
ncbi:MAG: NAD-dependent epimerase/dehydratase family protein [Kofleriaceae bacterium]